MNEQRGTEEARSSMAELISAIASISVVGLATGLTLPLVSLKLHAQDGHAALISAMAALPAVGNILIALLLPRLLPRLSAKTLMCLATAVSCLSVLVLVTPFNAVVWALSRLMMGVGNGVLIALGEARILELSHRGVRGRWTGLYTTCFTACQVAGPVLLAVFGSASATPIVIATALHLVALGLLLRTTPELALQERTRALRLMEFIRYAPAIVAAVIFFSLFDSASLGLLPIYGRAIGHTVTTAALMVSVVFAGDTLLQIPIGWASDRFGRKVVQASCAGTVIGSTTLIVTLDASGILLWPLLFMLGAAAGGLYTLALVSIGDRFRGERLVGANAFAGLLWGIGSLCGPVAGGMAMRAVEPHGLMLLVTAVASVCLLLILRSGSSIEEAVQQKAIHPRP